MIKEAGSQKSEIGSQKLEVRYFSDFRHPISGIRFPTSCFLLLAFCFLLIAPAAFAKQQKLIVWAMGEEGIRITGMARKFEQENPGVKVITQAIPWGSAHEKLLTSVVGGLPPDVCQLGTTWMAEFAALNSLVPLEDFISRSSVIKKEKFFEGSWNTGVVDHKVYGIPWYVDTRVLFYRKDILAKAGIREPPKSWDELKKACELLTRDTNKDGKIDAYGISLPVSGWGTFFPFVWQNNGDPFKTTSPKFVEAMKFYLSLFRENLVPTGRAIDVDLFQAFKSGFYPMFVSGPWMVELIKKELPELDGKWAVAMVPGKGKRTSFVGGCNLVIFKDSKEHELSWKFVEFMSRPENQIEWHKLLKSLPAVKEAWENPLLKNDPMLSVFGKQMEDVNSPPAIPAWEQIANSIDNRMEAIVLNNKITEQEFDQALNNLQEEINQILSAKKSSKYKMIPLIPYMITILILILFFTLIFMPIYKFLRSPEVSRGKRGSLGMMKYVALRSIPGYLFITPAIVILTLFLFIPVIISFFISLTDWNVHGLADKYVVEFIGFKNYFSILQDLIFWKSLSNTVIFTLFGVLLNVMVSLLCATILNEKFLKFKTFFRTAYYIPVVSTIVAVAVIWRWLYNPEYGLLNWILQTLSLPTLNWLSDPKTALASIILMATWKNFGANMIIFLAGLQNISESLYEAARIDGANAWQLFLNVTLPGLRPTTIFVLIMSTIGYLQCFAEPYVMTKGGPLNSTISVVLYMYNQGFKFFQLGYSSAIAYILFGIIFIVTLFQIWIRKSGLNEA